MNYTTSRRQPKRVRPARRSTHSARKEEKAALLQELRTLQARAEDLRWRQEASTRTLTGAVQRQTAEMVDVQAQFSAFVVRGVRSRSAYGRLTHTLQPTQVLSPIAVSIRLGSDRSDRVATLAETRGRQLAASRAFLTRRCGALDERRAHAEDQRFETARGDYCVVRLSVDQFDGAASVRQVFDALLFHFRHLEISVSEKLGTVAVRENDDDEDGADDALERRVHQNRLVGVVGGGLLVETNAVVFSQFADGCGIIATETVDDDELYPYRPDERVRKDHSMILQLTSFTQKAPGDDERDELVVVLTRWEHVRVHRPSFRVPRATMRELREGLDRFSDAVPRLVRETLRVGVL